MHFRTTCYRSAAVSFVLLFLISAGFLHAEVWRPADSGKMTSASARYIKPVKARYFEPDMAELRVQLAACPQEGSGNIRNYGKIMEFPLPDGRMARFAMASYAMMEPALAARWDFAKTYTGQGIDDPAATMKADLTPMGFHYQILSPAGSFYADPVFHGDDRYLQIYNKNDLRISDKAGPFVCGLSSETQTDGIGDPGPSVQISSGGTRRTYRLAVAATAEYTTFHGGVTGAASAIVTSVNRVVGVYELEVAVRLVLVSNNNLLIYTNSSTDPYSNSNGSTMLGQNQTNINSVIGSANYDMGHVFSTGGGGIASLGSVCNSTRKAQGVTGSPQPVGDPFDIDYVAHEMGHQFGGNHTFNSQSGSCSGNRSSNAAYEPGSGTTIMAYAGICGSDDLQNNSNAYFVFKSYEEITTFISNNNSGGSCPVKTTTGNTPPAIPAIQGGFTIPISTPFRLTAPLATDADGDALTYCWEQSDLGTAGAPGNTTGPIIRSFTPVTSRERIVPRLPSLLINTTVLGEKLPTVARTMSFKLLVRDNVAGSGGANQGTISFSVNATGGAFSVTAPNVSSVNWEGGSRQAVTWNPGSTASAPFNTPRVRIKLSTDGGNTFPFTLADSVQNDGNDTIQVPVLPTTVTQCRVMVEAIGNIFFDLSNANFRITTPTTANIPLTLLSSSALCAGEQFSVAFQLNDGTVYNSNNVFRLLLSDASGNFTNAVVVGTDSGSVADTILAKLPLNLAAGSGYKLRVTSTSPARTGSATISAPAVNALPATPASVSGPLSVCDGDTVAYAVPAQTGSSGFSWKVPAGCSITFSNADSSSIKIVFNGSGGVLSASALNGCGAGPARNVTLSRKVVLPALVTVNTSSASICQGSAATFTANPTNGGTNPQFQWLVNDSLVSGATSQSYTSSALATGNVIRVILISSESCTAVNSDTSAGLAITIIQPQTPTASIESDAQADTICQGVSVNFISTISSAGGTSPKYAWFRNNSQLLGQTQNVLQLNNPVNGDSIRMRLTVTGGCLTSNVVFSPAIRLTVLNPVANAGDDQSVCPASQIQLTGLPAGGSWTGSNVTAGGLYSAPASGSSTLTYSVFIYGCNRTDTRQVSVYQVPPVTFLVSGDTLKAQAEGAISWKWFRNNEVISGEENQQLITTEPGTYCCEATFANTCSGKSACSFVAFTGVSNAITPSDAVKLHPNPATATISLSWTSDAEKLEVFGMDGRLALCVPSLEGVRELQQLSIRDLPSGIYQIRLISRSGSAEMARLKIDR